MRSYLGQGRESKGRFSGRVNGRFGNTHELKRSVECSAPQADEQDREVKQNEFGLEASGTTLPRSPDCGALENDS